MRRAILSVSDKKGLVPFGQALAARALESAQAGFDAGNRADFFALPGSQSPAVLNLCTTSNVVPAVPGLWRFNIRSGGVTVCGNGAREGTEECDDGNTVAGDGCSASCRTELPPGAMCTSAKHTIAI